MRCPECRSYGYRRKTMTPEWCCSECGHEWGRKTEPSCSSRSSFDRTPTTWNLVVDAAHICCRSIYGQGSDAHAWPPTSRVGRRFRHLHRCGRTARCGLLHNLGDNRAVSWSYFRHVRQAAGALDRAFVDGLRSFGVRGGLELQLLVRHTTHHRRRSSHGSPDHDDGVG